MWKRLRGLFVVTPETEALQIRHSHYGLSGVLADGGGLWPPGLLPSRTLWGGPQGGREKDVSRVLGEFGQNIKLPPLTSYSGEL